MSSPVVLITGALSGIGRAAAVAFAKKGAKVVVAGRRDEPGRASFMTGIIPTAMAARPLADSAAKELNIATRSENERNKAVVDEFYKAGIQGHLTRFAQYLHPDFTWTAPNYLPWGGTHTGATLFRDQVLSRLPDVFDFTRFSYDNIVAEDGHVVAVINMGVTGTDAIIQIADHWTVRDGKVASIWVAYFEPQALLEKLGIAHGLGR